MLTQRCTKLVLSACIVFILATKAIYGQGSQAPASPVSTEAGVVNEAAAVLQELATGTAERIPDRILAEASGIAIIPHYVRGAFVFGVSRGRGVLFTRDAIGHWSAPEFITMGGGSVGWQIGVQATDLVLVVRSPRSMDNIRRGKLTLGADASAAAGPIGRYASASTDAKFQAEILTYSRSRGLFAGISISGAGLQLDFPATQAFYEVGPNSAGTVPPSVVDLVSELTRYTSLQVQQPAASQFLLTSNASGQPLGSITAVASVEARAVRLSQSVVALQARVDEQWKQYLALPPDWFSGRQLSAEDVHSVLIRYERVKTNPQFAALRALPEFHQSLQEIRALEVQVGLASDHLFLPPPPNAPMVNYNRPRY